jgi:23S rRNA (pseudouridine1915-N3)-methyltransferase
MRIRLITIGNKMPLWVKHGFEEYAKRFSSFCHFELIEIPAEKRTKDSPIQRLVEREGEKLLAAIKPHHRVIALEIKGQQWSTELLAEQLKNWQADGKNIDLLIGGADGLSTACLQKADHPWSLGLLTLPHPLVRIMVIEQLYRAASILQNHPYHRG